MLEHAPRARILRTHVCIRLTRACALVGDKALRPIGMLSGGEKARVALATFCITPHNVVRFDEPSAQSTR